MTSCIGFWLSPACFKCLSNDGWDVWEFLTVTFLKARLQDDACYSIFHETSEATRPLQQLFPTWGFDPAPGSVSKTLRQHLCFIGIISSVGIRPQTNHFIWPQPLKLSRQNLPNTWRPVTQTVAVTSAKVCGKVSTKTWCVYTWDGFPVVIRPRWHGWKKEKTWRRQADVGASLIVCLRARCCLLHCKVLHMINF